MILREHEPLFQGQIKNSLTRKLIFCLKVSLLKVGHGLQGGWQKRRHQCAFQDSAMPTTYGVSLNKLSAWFSSVKKSIWVRQSVKPFPLLIANELHDVECLPYTLTQWVRSWLKVSFPFPQSFYEFTKVCNLRVSFSWCTVVASQNPPDNFCVSSPLISTTGWPCLCSWGAYSAVGDSHKHMINDKR